MIFRSPRELSERRADEARRIVARQYRLIADLKACNGYRHQEEELLAAFEKSLAIFEADLTTITASDALKI